jgi:ABC-type cobalt transport system, ATPase component
MIEVRDVSYSRAGEQILEHISFSLKKGESLAVLGANGSGKTTLLRLLDALYVPKSGKIFIDGLDTSKERNKREIHKMVGFVFQKPSSSFVARTVREDILFTLSVFDVPKQDREEKVRQALSRVGLEGFEEREIKTLSGGEAQRLAIASALSGGATFFLFDEALSMLDEKNRREVLHLIGSLRKEGFGYVSITHESDEAIGFDKVLVLKDGCVAAFGKGSEVLRNYPLLESADVAPPFAVRVYESLLEKGHRLPSVPLSPEELEALL